ncbi:MAG: Rne/Rng family ribonuclease [Verrucomicrobiota bacterium]|jgi:ribonuclease G|nr:Rne/Rng family ribonuclease [Verrucomicrobiota bacterium]
MKEIIINVEKLETRVALLEDGRLEEFSIERSDRERLAGSIFKGRIHNLEEGLQAAFVDIGVDKNAFLHFWDMEPRGHEDIDDFDTIPDAERAEITGASISADDLERPVEVFPLASAVDSISRDTGAGQEDASFPVPPRMMPRALRGKNRAVRISPCSGNPFDDGNPVSVLVSEEESNGKTDVASRLEISRSDLIRVPASREDAQRMRRTPRHDIDAHEIAQKYPPGSEILVQVTKGPIGTKGARVTTNLSIPGRYLVLLPKTPIVGVSRKIGDDRERERLKKQLRRLEVPKGMGVIVRTVGQGQDVETFSKDLEMLLFIWKDVEEKIVTYSAPTAVYQEPDVVERTIRDYMTETLDRIVLDSSEHFERVRTLVGHIANRQARNKVKLYNENRPIFERFHVERQIENAFRRRVWLANGGYIVIDETEALVAIDINTGRHKGGKDQGTTALEVNLEAADEIARQLRLRNIGGLIVIDFIDMRSRKDQHTVVRRLRDAVKRDRAKVRIFPMSSLGLVEMTRQRVEESIRSAIFQDCPYCEGRGFVKSTLSMSVEIQRKLAEVLRRHFEGFKPSTDDANLQTTEPPEPHLRIFVHPEVLERLRDEDEELLLDLERKFGGRLSFRGDDSYRSEEFRIVDVSTGDELH